MNYAYLNRYDELYSEPFTDISGLPTDTIIDDEEVTLKKLGPNTGMTSIWDGALGVYRYELEDVHPLRGMWYAVTTYDCGDPVTHSASRESDQIANAVYFAPSGDPAKEPMVVPNPYRADQNYTDFYPAGMPEWVPENNHEDPSLFATGELLWFYNLPEKCLIRIFTVSGELVQIVAHNQPGDLDGANGLIYAEPWNLLTRDGDPVVSGLYLFSVEDKTDAKEGELKRGKFVVIR